MENKLTGNPYEYIEKIRENSSKKKKLSREGNKTESFWNTQCPSDAFRPHPDARQSILYRPMNK